MRTETFDALARLLAYPRADFRDALAEARATAPEPVATSLARFDEAVDGLQPHELEEAFTTTFDLDPVAALEVGWHLFGDTYERGRFLVEMRQRLHRLGMGESGELPDHLATVLRVLPRLDARDAEQLVQGAVMPALHKMLEPLRSRESLYLPLLQAVDALLAEVGTGCAGPFPDPAQDERRTAAGGPYAPTAPTAVGTGCAGPFPDPAQDERRTAAGGPYAPTAPTAVGTGCAGPFSAPSQDTDPEVTA